MAIMLRLETANSAISSIPSKKPTFEQSHAWDDATRTSRTWADAWHADHAAHLRICRSAARSLYANYELPCT